MYNEKQLMENLETVLDTITHTLCTTMNVYPCDINYGHCFVWTILAHELLIQSQIWSDTGHCALKIGDKFYDSDAPQGVPDWDMLPCNERYGCDNPYRQSGEDAVSFWTLHGNEEGVDHLHDERLMEFAVESIKIELERKLEVAA
jgi:hypothetical protein